MNRGRALPLAIRTAVFAVLLPGTVFVLLPIRILAATAAQWSFEIGPLRLLGLVPLVLGTLVLFWGFAGFVLEGQGTPAPYDPPRRLVTGQLYARVRNPMYVAGTLVLVGEALLAESFALFAYAGLVWVGFHLFVVLYEEPGLRRRFGLEYEAYLARVPRWIPRAR